ncbi:Pex2 / Pex12 amino terminal region [Necator americanus]|uniref:Pex2 / Pex12 amino terminal region n=1 Tax=Necator americanus TaxID=51031 RepID=W2T0S0_NECAM|nr:Pex2 / Pex12 amino terminal region [Necator americanus]ETN75159.1 Pex2 / Pex12 amino terminal region [Necator americanus]
MASTLRAAHLASLQHATGDQPSIFDILSQESLMTSLKPAVGHLLKFSSSSYRSCIRIGSRPQIIATTNFIYFLISCSRINISKSMVRASFSENFYGMKRIYQSSGSLPHEFNARIRSLIVLVLWPYVRDKLDKWHDIWIDKIRFATMRTNARYVLSLQTALNNCGSRKNDLRMKLGRIFVRFWPLIKALLTFTTTVLQLGYIINRSTVHSPFLWFAGVRLEKLTAEDLKSFERIPMHLQSSGILNRLWRFFLALPGIFSRLFGYGLFFVQFIDFIYNSDFGSQLKKKTFRGRVPPAPHRVSSNRIASHDK